MTMNNKQIGAMGERLAQVHLLEKGYRILETNFRTKLGELDIIALDSNGCMAIVEVKTDTSRCAGSPESWVTPKKVHQINKIAKIYVALNTNHIQNIRFDVISVVITSKTPIIKHIENAFMPIINSN